MDIEGVLAEKAAATSEVLNWRDSIVDLMKLLGLDSSIGARKQLAQRWGYPGAPDGGREMNIWLHQQLVGRVRQAGGDLPGDLAPAESEPQQPS